MASKTMSTTVTWAPQLASAAFAQVSRWHALPVGHGRDQRFCLHAETRSDADAGAAYRPVVDQQFAAEQRLFLTGPAGPSDVRTSTAPTTTVPTISVHNEKHDSGTSTWRPPV